MSRILAPTGMNTIPAPVAPVPPQITAVSGGSQYLRFKRRNQTIFLHCEPQEVLGAVKLRLAAILAIDEEDIRLYEHMTEERRRHVLSLLEEKLKEAAKLRKKKPGEPKPNIEEELKAIEIPPLPNEKKLWELGLENDAIVHFVYRTHPMTDWEEWENFDPSGPLLGACAGQTPGGESRDVVPASEKCAAEIPVCATHADPHSSSPFSLSPLSPSGDGFDPPGTAAARAAAAAAAAAAASERAAQIAREEEAALEAAAAGESAQQ